MPVGGYFIEDSGPGIDGEPEEIARLFSIKRPMVSTKKLRLPTRGMKQNRWAERHDCAVMSSKGFSTRAARDLIDKLVEHDEPIMVFCAHDADASGTMIYQTLEGATKARGARKIQIINLGLEPWEARRDGAGGRDPERSERVKPVADYITEYDDDDPTGRTGYRPTASN